MLEVRLPRLRGLVLSASGTATWRVSASLGLISLLGAAICAAQSVKPLASGASCEPGWYPYDEFCIQAEALQSKGMDAIVREMRELRKSIRENATFPEGREREFYLSRVESDADGVLNLENGAVVKVTSSGLDFAGYRDRALLFRSNSVWKLWIANGRVLYVDVVRVPSGKPSVVAMSYVQASPSAGSFLIDGIAFHAKVPCSDLRDGDPVIFLEGTPTGACVSAQILNVRSEEACELTCE
jgi:ribosomal protein S17